MKYTLDQHVESDYVLVYFHHGLSSRNKPSLHWLQSAYREFDRKCVPWALGQLRGAAVRWARAGCPVGLGR